MDVKVARGYRTEQIIQKTCSYWLQGRCTKNPCRFLHSVTPSSYINTMSSNDHTRKRHFSDYGESSYPSSCRVDPGSYYARKRSSFKYERSPSNDTIKNTKNRDEKDRTTQVPVASLKPSSFKYARKHNSSFKYVRSLPNKKNEIILDTNDRDEKDKTTQVPVTSQKPSPSICKYWINDNCVHGDQCRNLHSWSYGDGLATIAKLQGHKKLVTGIALPLGSDKLYSGSTDGTLRTWDCNTGQCANVMNLGAEVTSLISEGPWIFLGLQNAVKAYNIHIASQYSLDGPKGKILAMFVANDTLFAGAEDGVIYAWKGISEANSPFKPVASLCGHTKSVFSLAGGLLNRLYSGSMDQSIKVWDLDTFECTMTLNGHTDVVTSLICWDNYLLSGSLDNTIKVWCETEDKTLKVESSHSGVLSLNGTTDTAGKHILFCSSRDNSVYLYELPSFSDMGRLFARRDVGSIALGHDGLIFTGDGSGLVTVSKWLQNPKMSASS